MRLAAATAAAGGRGLLSILLLLLGVTLLRSMPSHHDDVELYAADERGGVIFDNIDRTSCSAPQRLRLLLDEATIRGQDSTLLHESFAPASNTVSINDVSTACHLPWGWKLRVALPPQRA